MRKFTIPLICILILLCQTACNNNQETESKNQVVINLSDDGSVNGYRVSDNKTEEMPEKISNKDTLAGNVNPTPAKKYCANKNSKVFHKISCSSVSKIKSENRVYYSDSSELISKGYSPCQRCSP